MKPSDSTKAIELYGPALATTPSSDGCIWLETCESLPMIPKLMNADAKANREAIEWLLNDLRSQDALARECRPGKNHDKILAAARATLIDLGYGNFTMREVASRSGVHLKTLQHYFRTKGDLLYEAIDHSLVHFYYDSFIGIFETLESASYEEMLEETVRFLVVDATNRGTSKLFFDLWALAVRDEDARKAVDHFYSRYRQLVAWLIGKANPHLGPNSVALRAAVVVSQIEGSMLFLSKDMPEHPELAGLDQEVVRAILAYTLRP